MKYKGRFGDFGGFAADTYVKQSALTPTGNSLGSGSVRAPLSLLDPSRFHLSQSYSLSYYSGGGTGQMIGMYLSQVDYEFAKPLHLSVALGFLHQPQTLVGISGQSLGNRILPSFRLSWDPSDKFHFIMGYETRSPYQMNYMSQYRRY